MGGKVTKPDSFGSSHEKFVVWPRPKKYHEAWPPEELPTDALSQIVYGHTGHCEV